jgi:hypothetical protein
MIHPLKQNFFQFILPPTYDMFLGRFRNSKAPPNFVPVVVVVGEGNSYSLACSPLLRPGSADLICSWASGSATLTPALRLNFFKTIQRLLKFTLGSKSVPFWHPTQPFKLCSLSLYLCIFHFLRYAYLWCKSIASPVFLIPHNGD